MKLNRDNLKLIYDRLYESYGPQHWWPADTPFEVMVGAVLTQNTNWKNVEKAISSLKKEKKLSPEGISDLRECELAHLIRSSGFFNVKARRVKNLTEWLVKSGGTDKLAELQTEKLRQELLSVNGIGRETADDILLYAFNRAVFVIDAYTRRLLGRLDLINGNEGYEELRRGFEENLEKDPYIYNEYHALIVRHAKEKCQSHSECRHCFVESRL